MKINICADFIFGLEGETKEDMEKTIQYDAPTKYAQCIAGKRNCPPEDCGGPYGYHELLAILNDPRHKDHAEMQEWVGGYFDSEYFDIEEVNTALRKLR